jgi:hypothetical protein
VKRDRLSQPATRFEQHGELQPETFDGPSRRRAYTPLHVFVSPYSRIRPPGGDRWE